MTDSDSGAYSLSIVDSESLHMSGGPSPERRISNTDYGKGGC